MKVCTHDQTHDPSQHRELQFYEHVSALKSSHKGQAYIRGLIETFMVNGPSGQHLCLVHPPMHVTVRELQHKNASHRLNTALLKWVLHNILSALSFLHDEAKVVHTGMSLLVRARSTLALSVILLLDINPSNIMWTIRDQSLLHDFEQAEAERPSAAKVIDDMRIIYGTRKFGLPKGTLWGDPILCDFGEARIGEHHHGLIQPEPYRAPEVLFDMEWSTSVDIWNIAVLVSLHGLALRIHGSNCVLRLFSLGMEYLREPRAFSSKR